MRHRNSQVAGEFPAQRASNAENVFVWWRHHDQACYDCHCSFYLRKHINCVAVLTADIHLDTHPKVMASVICYFSSAPWRYHISAPNFFTLLCKKRKRYIRHILCSACKQHESTPWRRHQMETFSSLLAICAGNSPVSGEFPAQRPVTRGFDVFYNLRPDKRLSKQSWGWWFETPSHSLWRHRNA